VFLTLKIAGVLDWAPARRCSPADGRRGYSRRISRPDRTLPLPGLCFICRRPGRPVETI